MPIVIFEKERYPEEILPKFLKERKEEPRFPEVVRSSLIRLPVHYRELKWLMTAQIRKNPRIEMGGAMLTNQLGDVKVLFMREGDGRSIRFPVFDPQIWESGEFDTYVEFHSHPVGYEARFSSADREAFERCVDRTHTYLQRLIYEGGDSGHLLNLYQFVFGARRRNEWMGTALWIRPGALIPKDPKKALVDLFPFEKVKNVDFFLRQKSFDVTSIA